MPFQLFPSLCALVIVSGLLLPSPATGQSFNYAQDCLTNVDNAHIHVSPSNSLTLPSGDPIAAGDTVAVYTDTGTCAGYDVWHDQSGITLAASGPDTVNPSGTGYADGEPLKVEVFDVSQGVTADVGTDVVFESCSDSSLPICEDDGTYARDTIHKIASLGDTTSTLTRSIATEDGWNLLSVPVQSADPTFDAVFPACTNGFVFEPGTGYSPIQESDPVSVGRGVFAQCVADTTTVTGERVPNTLEVGAGWQIIGVFEDTVSVDAVTSNPNGIIASNFFAMSPSQGYQMVTTLHPGAAYWVNMAEAGTLDLSGGAAPSSAAIASRERRPTPDRDATRLVFTDAAGQQAELRFYETHRESVPSPTDLPPPPPASIFSVRFASGQAVAPMPSRSSQASHPPRHEIRMQGASYPVEVHMQTGHGDHIVTLNLDQQGMTLTGKQPVAHITQRTRQFSVEAAKRPESFALSKPRPNPAHGQAHLQYRLPEESEVSIDLYDILGRRVAQFVQQRKEAGTHELQVDSRGLSSGVYFVRMTAGSFQQTRRMRIVR
jgi:hypothetical protein